MTAPLTIKDLNCGNCTNRQCKAADAHGAILCKIGVYSGDYLSGVPRIRYWITKKQQEHIAARGCASHPLALQVLAGPVIEELEKRAAHAAEGENSRDDFQLEWKAGRTAYEEAAALLKDVMGKL